MANTKFSLDREISYNLYYNPYEDSVVSPEKLKTCKVGKKFNESQGSFVITVGQIRQNRQIRDKPCRASTRGTMSSIRSSEATGEMKTMSDDLETIFACNN